MLSGTTATHQKVDLRLPSFEAVTEWLNRQGAALETKGRPILVHFWSISAETAKTNLAQVAALRDQRKREGLRVIAVHVPHSEAEKDPRVVRDALARLNLAEPCAPPFAASLGIPRRVSVGIMHALAKEPDDRPQTATELARQMQLI